VGVISKSKENIVWRIGFESESSSLDLYFDNNVQIWSSNKDSEYFNKNNEFELEDNSTVDVEVDCEKKAIYYFINKKQCPAYVSDISSSSFPLLFGFASDESPIIEVLSVQKLNKLYSLVNSSVACEPMKWVFMYLLIIVTVLLKINSNTE
jgi:hypothetical protein